MTFLQPFLLWLLPLVALPVVIHLLNRMRYRSVRWAAMEFLFRATRQSTRQAKLRHWLILVCRTLAVLAIILALARPLVGGWLGWAFRGAPDTVLIVLDRSASMEQQLAATTETKRARAVARLAEAARQLGGATRWVLLDSGTRQAHEISSPAVLPEVSVTAATDAAADIPALVDAAVEYLVANQSGRTEIWIASDWQASNWSPDGAPWPALAERLAALPQNIQVRLLGLTDGAGDNLSVTVAGLTRQVQGATHWLELTIDLAHNRSETRTFPLAIILDGHRSVVDVTVDGPQTRWQHRVNLGDRARGGFGWVELPADANPRDNRAFFAYNAPQHLRAVIVSDEPRLARVCQLAAVPAPALLNQSADVVPAAAVGDVNWDDVALVICGGCGAETSAVLNQFVARGGVVLEFPLAGEFESAPTGALFRVTTWRQTDGPLANTQEGRELPVADLQVSRRRVLPAAGVALASFADGKPFLTRQPRGKGAVYQCATVPVKDWSDLAEGRVLVPLLQRLLQEGGQRLSQVQEQVCGTPVTSAATEPWVRLDQPDGGAHQAAPLQAGVYQVGNRVVPVNRPPAEDAPETLAEPAVRALFGAVPVRSLAETAHHTGRLQSEIWRAVLVAALLFLVGEGLLTRPPAAEGGP